MPSFDEPVLTPAPSLNTVPLLPVIRQYFAQLGRRGGAVKSDRKTLANRLNGLKPKVKRG